MELNFITLIIVIEINFCDGGVGGVMEIIDQTNREKVLYIFFYFKISLCCFFVFSFSGGILGWDPVHTTCISDEMMVRL